MHPELLVRKRIWLMTLVLTGLFLLAAARARVLPAACTEADRRPIVIHIRLLTLEVDVEVEAMVNALPHFAESAFLIARICEGGGFALAPQPRPVVHHTVCLLCLKNAIVSADRTVILSRPRRLPARQSLPTSHSGYP